MIPSLLVRLGFVHSSFTFGQESFITRTDIKPSAVAPGMLISLLQKGLQYTAIEFHLNEDGSEKECSRPWSLLDPHVCEQPTTTTITNISNDSNSNSVPSLPSAVPVKTKKSKAPREINLEDAMPDLESVVKASKKRKKESPPSSTNSKSSRSKSQIDVVGRDNGGGGGNDGIVERFIESEVLILTGHQSEVISCAWNPRADLGLLASVAGDDTGRIWPLGLGKLEPEQIISHEHILPHDHPEGKSKEITTLDWSPDGESLVTGCYDGKATIWSRSGELIATLDQFKGALFALKWSPSGKYIAGAGLELCALVWEVANPEKPFRLYQNHTSPTMDLDWKNDHIFATCTTEKSIYIYDIEKDEDAIKVLHGHDDEINSVKWSPDGNLLASCSDDGTARIWDISTETLKWILKGHTKEIYCLKWSPSIPDRPDILATASFDHTIRLWDPSTGQCLHTLQRHTDSVYAIGFSPDGRFIASGSLDETLNVWSVDDGSLVRTYDSGRGGIFELAWSPTGDRLATCTSDSTVCVFDFIIKK